MYTAVDANNNFDGHTGGNGGRHGLAFNRNCSVAYIVSLCQIKRSAVAVIHAYITLATVRSTVIARQNRPT